MGELTCLKAEAVMDLIDSKNEMARKKFYDAVKGRIIRQNKTVKRRDYLPDCIYRIGLR